MGNISTRLLCLETPVWGIVIENALCLKENNIFHIFFFTLMATEEEEGGRTSGILYVPIGARDVISARQ